MPRASCDRDHTDLGRTLLRLPKSQAAPGRHVCAGCAFEAGYARGKADADNEWRRKVADLQAKVRAWAEERGQDSRTLPRGR